MGRGCWSADVLDYGSSRYLLISDEHRRELTTLASENAVIGGPARHLSLEFPLSVIVHDWVEEGRERAPRRWGDIIARDGDRFRSVGTEDCLGRGRSA